jgi:hypothetical protein
MLNDKQISHIQDLLFSDDSLSVYAIIDGASCPELRFKIYDWQPQSQCLWSGKLEPDIEEVAPYMVELERNSDFTLWLIKNGFENNWNIFVASQLEPKAFRKQIRKLQLVRSDEGKTMMFRFYDPRVMAVYLPTCDMEQLKETFEGLERVYVPRARSLSLNTYIYNRVDKTLTSNVQSIKTVQAAWAPA